MMRAAFALALAFAAPAAAQDFAATSEAKAWGLFGERKARFAATVTDAACVLTGDCPDDCGGGLRQMALIREADGVMVLALKNGQPVFSGAPFDLAPFCKQRVEVDGVLIGDPQITPAAASAPLYMVQRIRPLDGDWQPADRFTRAWRERYPDAGEGPWFRNDPRIDALIEADGYLGLGPEADAAFVEESR